MTYLRRSHVNRGVQAGLALALLAFGALGAQALSVDTKNLIRNGDFEEAGSPPPGWQVVTPAGGQCDLSSNSITGRQALRIAPSLGGSISVISDPCPVVAGDDYLLTFWGRGDGAKEKGGIAWCYVQWLDAAGKAVGNLMVTVNSPLPEYDACTATITAPATAVQAAIRFVCNLDPNYKGPITAFYFDQIRLMHMAPPVVPANAPTWEYLRRQLQTSLKMVEDPEAAEGQAIMAELGFSKPNLPLTWSHATRQQPVGDYLIYFRIKVKDNTKPEPVAGLEVTCRAGGYNNLLAPTRTVLATEFKQPGVYQDFAVRFVRFEEGVLDFLCWWRGTTDLYFDKVTVVQLERFRTDKEQAAIWLGE